MTESPRLGFFIQPVHPPRRRYAEVLREDREAFELADRLGFREGFAGEHLADSAETITSSLTFIASLADRCPSIVFGTGSSIDSTTPTVSRNVSMSPIVTVPSSSCRTHECPRR